MSQGKCLALTAAWCFEGRNAYSMFLIPDELRHSSARALYDSHSKRAWSYAELCDTVQKTGEMFASRKKALFFLFCRNDAASVIGYLAAVEAGHAVALLDEELAPEFKKRLIDLYEPEFIIGSVPTVNLGNERIETSYSAASVGDPALYVWSSDSPRPDSLHPELALLLSTSGSTGTPKFVRLTQRNVESNAHSIRAGLQITHEENPITSLPIHYSYGLSVVNSHLAAGAGIVLTNLGLMSSDFWSIFREQECTSWAGVPYSYQILKRLDLNKLNVPSLRTLTQAGGKLHTDMVAHFHSLMSERDGRFFVMYGQTEATARICILPSGMLPEKLGSAGRAIEKGALAVESELGLTDESEISGEIFYRGPNVMMGYANCRADLGMGDELNGTLRTGDLGYLDSDGYLFLTGRRKRDAKVLGLRLNMDEVEEMLRPHGPTAVISGDEKLIIYCEHGDNQAFGQYAKELSSRLKIHTGAFEFRRITQLPLNANGKINYQELGQHA